MFYNGKPAHQPCQPHVSFRIAFSIKQPFPLGKFLHWLNVKTTDPFLSTLHFQDKKR